MEPRLMVSGAERTVEGVLFACDLWACGDLVMEVGFCAGAMPAAFVGIGGTAGTGAGSSRTVGEDGVEVVVGGEGRPDALAALLRKAADVLDARIAARAVGGRVVGQNS